MTEVSKAEATDIKQTVEVEAASSKVDTSCKKIEEEFKAFQKKFAKQINGMVGDDVEETAKA